MKAALAAIAEEEKNIPATGDTSHPGLWIALLFVSGGIAGGTAAVRKKKKTCREMIKKRGSLSMTVPLFDEKNALPAFCGQRILL